MPRIPKKHLTERYPKSKTIRAALLKRNKLSRKIAVCQHDQIDYKSDLETQESQKLLEQPADYKNDPSKKDPKNNDDDLPDFE